MPSQQLPHRWRKADEFDLFLHCENHEQKNIYYAREYTSGEDYNYSETNKFIKNLKKKMSSTEGELYYKGLAIQQFAEEATSFFSNFLGHNVGVIIPIPPSFIEGDPRYDDRLIRVSKIICRKCPNTKLEKLLQRSSNKPSNHLSSTQRSVEHELKTLSLSNLIEKFHPSSRDVLVIFDDVTTSGSTFEAARTLLSNRYPSATIIGVIWAKAKDSRL